MAELLELSVVYDTKFMSMTYCENNKLLWGKWIGAIPSDILRKEMLHTCDFLLEKKVELILTDYSRLQPPNMSDQVWIAENTTRRLINSAIRRIASIQSFDLIQQQVMDSIITRSYKIDSIPWVVQNFISVEPAIHWLLTGEDIS
ncbi:hypothetical protein [Pontibacter arcticus]|uniref:SpoIIAA-like n=1 Tax=Pontibacter arcticus TaxID=2080288 RepID=A0A364RE58_9BACT|nr:hypothetical protein [Pontibacter arcticus]RAU82525.1 hypothetical protein DP923_12155 [Pontibacter arcticus]